MNITSKDNVVWHGCKIDDLILQLPFEIESLSNISESSDFISFSQNFTWTFDHDFVKQFLDFAHEKIDTINFKIINSYRIDLSSQLISAIKYQYTIEHLTQGLIGEDMVYGVHLPYLTEATIDMQCSIELLRCNFYKQSLQSLRNALEVTVAHAYFAIQGIDIFQLRQYSNFQMPKLTTKNGMLRFLVVCDLFNESESWYLIDLYRKLSAAVHSEITLLNFFHQENEFEYTLKWCKYNSMIGSAIIKIVLKLLKKGI